MYTCRPTRVASCERAGRRRKRKKCMQIITVAVAVWDKYFSVLFKWIKRVCVCLCCTQWLVSMKKIALSSEKMTTYLGYWYYCLCCCCCSRCFGWKCVRHLNWSHNLFIRTRQWERGKENKKVKRNWEKEREKSKSYSQLTDWRRKTEKKRA